MPPLVEIPGGVYSIGSDEGLFEDEAPMHPVELKMGKFPVTNGEWALFMKARGYGDERWWDTEEAKAWQRGESTAEGPKQQWRENRKWLQDNYQRLEELKRFTSEEIKAYRSYADMTDEEFEALLEGWHPPGRPTQPVTWNDDSYNNPAQPVSVCWHEARAYCAWLSVQTGQPFRLPTEAERKRRHAENQAAAMRMATILTPVAAIPLRRISAAPHPLVFSLVAKPRRAWST